MKGLQKGLYYNYVLNNATGYLSKGYILVVVAPTTKREIRLLYFHSVNIIDRQKRDTIQKSKINSIE